MGPPAVSTRPPSGVIPSRHWLFRPCTKDVLVPPNQPSASPPSHAHHPVLTRSHHSSSDPLKQPSPPRRPATREGPTASEHLPSPGTERGLLHRCRSSGPYKRTLSIDPSPMPTSATARRGLAPSPAIWLRSRHRSLLETALSTPRAMRSPLHAAVPRCCDLGNYGASAAGERHHVIRSMASQGRCACRSER